MFGRNGRDHFAPHSSARFEGYYSRVQLDDGGTIAIIFCWVKGAKERANLVFITYMPISDTKTWNALLPKFKYELYPKNIDISGGEHTPKESQQFLLTAPGIGTMNVTPDTIEYDIAIPEKSYLSSCGSITTHRGRTQSP
ncbi:hypothetical protein A0H81_02107 [Grifola frondosa]|uniref:Uncharacterized protein n=1 Tax=Grifola frondosa TaxID=5627 RepID=A0A1C7MQL6_GRIFR|nr:hypothetical protein A0H81_02107 [Grifola frondosa]